MVGVIEIFEGTAHQDGHVHLEAKKWRSLLEYLILRFISRQMYVVHHHPSQHIFITLLSMRKSFKKQMPVEARQRSVRANCVEDFRGLDPRVSEPAQISSSGDVTALLEGCVKERA